MSDEGDFLHGDNCENFLCIDTMILDGHGQLFETSQNSKFVIYLQ